MTDGPRRRSISREELRIWRDYLETGDVLRARLASRLQSESALSTGDYAVLLALSEAADHRLRASALAAAIEWERSRLSHHLGRMERRELIRREECPEDSRGAEVVLTELGAQSFRRAAVPHLRAVQELFVDALTPAQLEALDDVMTTLRQHLGLTRAS
jgi:DNA-binding MarR family transcriptional regulator